MIRDALAEAFDPRRWRREVEPELEARSRARTAVARQPLLHRAPEGGPVGADLGGLAQRRVGFQVGLARALGRVGGDEQARAEAERIDARRAFLAAREMERQAVEAQAQETAATLAQLGMQTGRGIYEAASVKPGGVNEDETALRLRRLRAFGSSWGLGG